jgi:polycystin 1L2
MNWTEYNETATVQTGMQNIVDSFKYSSAESMDSFPFSASYDTYLGGGYVYKMRGLLHFLKGNLSLLQQMDWIDRQTRAVFVEFAVYNPNMNMFMVATIVFEFLPTGNILKMKRFDSLNLFNEIQSNIVLKVLIYILYMLLVVYFAVKEIRALMKLGLRKYAQLFWSYVEWLIIGLSIAAFVLFFYRFYVALSVLKFFSETNGYSYIKLQFVNYCNQLLQYCVGFCVALGTIKFLKLLRFSQRIAFLASCLNFCLREIVGFGCIFLVIWLAFIHMLYLVLNEKLSGYSTFLKAMQTSFEILLGKFEAKPLTSSTPYVGTIVFTFYNLMIVIVSLNVFISIIDNSFTLVRKNPILQSKEHEVVAYMFKRFKAFLGIYEQMDVNMESNSKEEAYFDHVSSFPYRVEKLTKFAVQV